MLAMIAFMIFVVGTWHVSTPTRVLAAGWATWMSALNIAAGDVGSTIIGSLWCVLAISYAIRTSCAHHHACSDRTWN